MLRNVNKMFGFKIHATDGEIGKVDDFWFDDETWTIRYMVVNTGSWLAERKVLISTYALGKPEWETKLFNVNLTKEQVKTSPDIDIEKIVSREHEDELFRHYTWPSYWGGGFYGITPPPPMFDEIKEMKETEGLHVDPHLHSCRKIKGQRIHAIDGNIGHVTDFILDDDMWDVRSIIASTSNWLPGTKVLISPKHVTKLDVDRAEVYLELNQDSVRNCPVYDGILPDENYFNREKYKDSYDDYDNRDNLP